MSVLAVHHSTVYRYRDPVQLGEHRMTFRSRESYDLRLIQTNLVITPEPTQLRWLHDPFDNSVAVATFQGTTSELRFESMSTLEHFETSLPEHPIEAYARTYPSAIPMKIFPISSGPLLITTRARACPSGHCSFLIHPILPAMDVNGAFLAGSRAVKATAAAAKEEADRAARTNWTPRLNLALPSVLFLLLTFAAF